MAAIMAYGGIEGLRLTEEYRTSLSLVILDIMMPDLDALLFRTGKSGSDCRNARNCGNCAWSGAGNSHDTDKGSE